MNVFLFVLIALFGVLVGILSGMFGIGGGTMVIPLLNLIFRLPILTSTATSLFVIAPTSLSGAWRHLRQGTVDVRAAVTIGLSGAVASTFSASISDRLPDLLILLAAVSVILYSASSVMRSAFKSPAAPQKENNGEKNGTQKSPLLSRIFLGLFAGLVAGVVGVGGGFIIVPIGITYFGYSFKKASGTSLLSIALIAIPGIITHAILGHIWYLYGIALMVGTIPGANLGARLITKIPERKARFAYAGLLILSGIMLVVNRVAFG
ncbi:MAG: sulfite exporter TauE/SafE family protein [Coriobacteriales bacterium]|jgi:uncharacterized membrane protein YfcA|nr:sulfite exporter TauE/SafE family protein [Coriobacteriales bacterium]